MEGSALDTAVTVLSWACLAIGGASVAVGAIGILRMPDVFTRMHAASITDTMGAGFILLGLALGHGFTLVTAKLFLIFVFLMFTSPTASHALARAALHGGLRPRAEVEGKGFEKEAGSS